MKSILSGVSLLLILSFSHIQAQTTVMNFSKTDCNGIQTNLFEQLDSGFAVVIEYVMLPNCSPCITAGKGLKNILQSAKISQPERVKMFQISYDNTTTCANLKSWSNANGFAYPLFENGADEVNYYGGMGMPTIVIAGGNTHSIYYQKQGYSPAENNAITTAINNALNPINGIETIQKSTFKVYPQPAKNMLTVESDIEISTISLIDMTGKMVFNSNLKSRLIDIPLSHFPAGIYFIKCKDVHETEKVQKLIIE